MLAAVVIAVGLVFITRGFSSQLKALQTVQAYETLIMLARTRLLALEAERVARPIAEPLREGAFDAPYQQYRWSITTQPLEDEGAPYREMILTVRRGEDSSSTVRLSSIWPTEWILDEWL
jgi:hypothetical protein